MSDDERALDELAPDPVNPREMDDLARDGLGLAIAEFGDLGGIVFNWRTKELVAGHQRVDRLREAGAVTWRRTGETTGYVLHPATQERFPIRVVDWPPEKQRKANLVANNPAIQGKFTDEAALQLAALQADVDFKSMRLDALADALLAAGGGREATDLANDPGAHWRGMPEFDQQDKTAFRSVVVHFKTREDLDAFAKLVDQPITEKTRFLWYPFIEIERYADKAYE